MEPAPLSEHECQFPEEETPNGVRILYPCLLCGVTAFDGIAYLKRRLEEALTQDNPTADPATTVPSELVTRLKAIRAHRAGTADADLMTEIIDAIGQHEDRVTRAVLRYTEQGHTTGVKYGQAQAEDQIRQAVLSERARCLGVVRQMEALIVEGGA